MQIIINSGSGPVADASEQNAIDNLEHFIVDNPNKTEGVNWVRIPEHDYSDGRYAFLLWKNNYCYEIQMPGLPLGRVRYMGTNDQNVFDFPRLYVDGSSWLWMFAIDLPFSRPEEEKS